MMRRMRIPIRLKFTMTFLVLVTMVLGLITFSTANLFEDDKKAYVNGLTSMVALGTAEEARSLLDEYRRRLTFYARLILDDTVPADRERKLTESLFSEFPDLTAIWIERGGRRLASACNAGLLDELRLTIDDLEPPDAEPPQPDEQSRTAEPIVRNLPVSPEQPLFSMNIPLDGAGDEPATVRAVLLSDRLMQLTTRFSAYEQFLIDSEGRFLAHSDASRVQAGVRSSAVPQARAVRDEFSASVTSEYEQDGVPVIGGFANVDFAGIVAGAQIPGSAAHLASRRLVGTLLVVAGVLLAAAIGGGVLWSHRITRPMEKLAGATRTIAKGDFDIDVRVDSRDEIADLASSFNQMAVELKSREQKLRDANTQLVQSEKMAAFGQLGTGIAHEVKNPLTAILACAQLAAEDVAEGSQVHQDLKLIEKESNRCKSIIENLLKFARQEKAEKHETDVNGVIEDSIAIVNHQMELNEVHVESELQPGLPLVNGNANQLQQVFMNLMINAQQAMEGGAGRIRVTSRYRGDGSVELRFKDSGPGIPAGVREKIFEPFFTTKPAGKGTGMGLSVSYGIVRDHDGEIAVESEEGQGTTFVITLPASPPTAAAGDGALAPELVSA